MSSDPPESTVSDPSATGSAGFAAWIRRNRVLAIVLAALLVVLIVVGAVVATALAASQGPVSAGANAGSTATPRPSQSSTASPSPSASPGAPTPTPSPTIDPAFGAPVAATVDKAAPAQLTGSLTARIVSSTPITATGTQVGEVSGPAIQVVLELVNGSAASVSLDAVSVNGYYGSDLTPASPIVPKETSTAFAGSLAANAKATGTYVFSVPKSDQPSFVLTMSASAGGALIVFK
ncbi:hypothetical protein [Lacisediminihabitans sp. H27-G8]|uniref:hypothetical protein n=1 Tax=Lacisediminihabitans sp. H27-G8 TaxID=3111909 RepID=UPI0038FC0847